MFVGKNIWQILQMGGYTMYVLITCSIIALAVILERVFYYSRGRGLKREEYMRSIREALEKNDVQGALVLSEAKQPICRVVKAGLGYAGKTDDKINHAMERQINIEQKNLEQFTNILGTIGSTVVYIGLFGTVVGIIRAFQEISVSAGTGSGMGLVIEGIAEALVSTAAGILVAVPSVIAYNLLIKRVEDFRIDMELCASELADLLRN